MDKQEMKSCPLCDGEAVQDNQIFMGGIKYDDRARCSGYRGQNLTRCVLSKFSIPIQEWNTRPEEDKLNARIKELEEVVSEFVRLVKNKSIIHNKEKPDNINRVADLLIPLLNKGIKND